MRGRYLVVAGFLFGMAGSMTLSSSLVQAGPAAPTCSLGDPYGTVTATKWLNAPGTLVGTPGDDILIGSTGSDVIKGLGGDDVICPEPGEYLSEDSLGDIAPDTIDAGSGDDAALSTGSIKGGSGKDVLTVWGPGGKVDGGSGADAVGAGFGASADGGSGNDEVYGLDAKAINGGSGGDYVISNNSADTLMDCGAGFDTYEVYTDGGTANPGQPTIRRCEGLVPPP